METKNMIIGNYADQLSQCANTIVANSHNMGADEAVNKSIIDTTNVYLESLRSLTVLLQRALDEYSK